MLRRFIVIASLVGAVMWAAPSAGASNAQVARLVTAGIRTINTAHALAGMNRLSVIKVELTATTATNPNARTARALAIQGFGFALKQLSAQLKASADIEAGKLGAATKALDIPREWSTWPTLLRKAQHLLHLKTRLAKRFK